MRDKPASCLELLLWWLLPYPLILAAHYHLGVLWRPRFQVVQVDNLTHTGRALPWRAVAGVLGLVYRGTLTASAMNRGELWRSDKAKTRYGHHHD